MSSLAEGPEAPKFRPGPVRLVAASERWPVLFQAERDRLEAAANGAFLAIEHFGSTAVPGLRAKPIIDMMAFILDLSLVEALAPALRTLNYEITDVGFRRRIFFRKEPAADGVAYHLHITSNMRRTNKNELLLRDWLVRNPQVAARYEALKDLLAAEHPDDNRAYTSGKTGFLRNAVNAAREHMGLPPETDWAE
jgi:GrpB-like predicted nucleotidyltransferase (UPF0157 family)